MLNEKELKQYALEMGQICSAYVLGQKTTSEFIGCCQKLNDYISTLDNNNNQQPKEEEEEEEEEEAKPTED